jgi:MoxR-like ATPase
MEVNEVERAGSTARRILDVLDGVVLGQTDVLRQMLITLLAGGHALIEGVPGTAKTLAVRTLALALDVDFGRVQFTPDLMPTDLTGVNMLDELQHRFVFHPGPVFADLLLADEINRAPAKTQAALLEAMQERQVTVDGVSRPLPAVFTVFATQNPVEHEGTYPLPEAQLDRFLLKITMPYPSAAAERGVLDRYVAGFRADDASTYGIRPLIVRAELEMLRKAVHAVHVEPAVRDYIVAIVRATRDDASFTLPASPRASVALFSGARALAVLDGRDFVTPDDVKELAVPVLRHRVRLTAEAEVEGQSTDRHIQLLLDAVEAPRVDPQARSAT